MTTIQLSATMLSYLRSVFSYTEGNADPYTSWVTDHWQKTERALTKRGLIEDNPHPRQARDRQSVRVTDLGRETLADYEGRKTKVVTYGRAWGRRTGYRSVWDKPQDAVSKLGGIA